MIVDNTLTCDTCRAIGPSADSPSRAHEQGRALGWVRGHYRSKGAVATHQLDLCPDCVVYEALRSEALAVQARR